jgi:trimeric autotransporter adhesin
MACRRIHNYLRLLFAIALLTVSSVAAASEHHGQVLFGGLPAPGATLTATQAEKTFLSVTNQDGFYFFPDLSDGRWTIEVEMLGFATIKRELLISQDTPPGKWELQMLPIEEIKGNTQQVTPIVNSPPPKSEPAQPQPQKSEPSSAQTPEEDRSQLANDGLLINGSTNNAASSPFALEKAFGNLRNRANGMYTGGIGIIFDNAALDARPFSLSGQNTPRPAYNRMTAVATLGGPLKIPRLFRKGPIFFVGYQWTRDRDAATDSALVPDSAERSGNFFQAVNAFGQPVQIFDPTTGLQFPRNAIPDNQISPQAQALLNLYPLPNIVGNPRYNYQIPIVSNTHQDALQSRFDETLNPKNELYGDFAFQSTRTDDPNLFGFLDSSNVLGINIGIHWSHRFSQRLFLNLGYRFNRLTTRITPFFKDRENVSGGAGITGNNQEPMNWGPPSLTFSGGFAGLSDLQSSFDRNRTDAWSYSMLWYRDHHNLTFGVDFRRQQFNRLSQQDPRGTFAFTGAATQGTVNGATTGGSDLADFLLGIPDTSSIAFGNADKYFRESAYDAYITDDWRVSPQLTINAGIRWEYGAPITELNGRLVSLDTTPGFVAAAPVVANDPVGPLTGERYPDSLIHPDKRGVQPRVGISWRPISGSSLVVRAGFGIYYDTSVYQTLAEQMAQQAPLSKSLSVQNRPTCPLTLANGFNTCSSTTPNTFAADPRFRPGYAQNWQLALQRDLPGSLQLTATYLGIKGTRGPQEFLPNTYPIGAVNPCPLCPVGFAYLSSNGNSKREAGQVQLRRRLHNGLTGTLQYTYSKSIDDNSVLGGQGASAITQNTPQSPDGSTAAQTSGTTESTPMIAQNWLDLGAERGLSTFDQRHRLTAQLQYTTGMGIGGATLLRGWRGTLYKEWTLLSQITAGSGLPQTPIYLAPVPGTGITGSIRPDYTGAPIYAAPPGLFLNPAAYTAPASGQWGNAGRNSITGPAAFTFNASVARTFRLNGRFNLDLRMDSTNLLNHATFTGWNTTMNSTRFGLPSAANPMRSIHSSLRLRF